MLLYYYWSRVAGEIDDGDDFDGDDFDGDDDNVLVMLHLTLKYFPQTAFSWALHYTWH